MSAEYSKSGHEKLKQNAITDSSPTVSHFIHEMCWSKKYFYL